MAEIELFSENQDELVVDLTGISCDADHVNININEIMETHDDWLMSLSVPISQEEDFCRIKMKIDTRRPDTLCEIINIRLSKIKKEQPFSEEKVLDLVRIKDFERVFFKVCNERIIVDPDIVKEVKAIENRRRHKFNEPIGDLENKNARNFTLLVFVANCHLPRGKFYLDKCLVYPSDNLGKRHIAESVKNFLANRLFKGQDASFDWIVSDDTLIGLKAEEPTAVLYFPAIKAETLNSVLEIVKDRVENLVNLLSFRREAKVEVYAYVFRNHTDDVTSIGVPEKPYVGNLASDFVSESSRLIPVESKVANDKFLQLILDLYRHALGEKRPDFIYFHYWNIIETIARSKGYDLAKNLHGTVKLDRNGNPIRVGAGDMVRNLIKDIYQRKNINTDSHVTFPGEVKKTFSILDMVTAWNQHRNCTAHRGGCNPNDTSQCDTTRSPVVDCRRYTVGISPLELDYNLDCLQRMTRTIISSMLYDQVTSPKTIVRSDRIEKSQLDS